MMTLYAQMFGGPDGGLGGSMMNGWGGFAGPGFMWFGPVIGLIVMFLAIWFLVSLIRGSSANRSFDEKTPLEILKERYARGEISSQDYEERRQKLQNKL